MGSLNNPLDLIARRNGVFKLLVVGTDDIVATRLPDGFIGLIDGMVFVFESLAANTRAMTLDVGTGTAYPITHLGGAALVAGDIPAADTLVECFFDASNNTFHAQLIRQPGSLVYPGIQLGAVGASTRYAREDHKHPEPQGSLTNNNAAAGVVGEYVSAIVSSSAPTALTSGVTTSTAGLSLTAGDWNVEGYGGFIFNNNTGLLSAIVDITASLNAFDRDNQTTSFIGSATYGTTVTSSKAFSRRVSLAAPAIIYLTVQASWIAPVTGCSSYGGITARRAR